MRTTKINSRYNDKKNRVLISILIVFSLIFSPMISVYAADNDMLVLELNAGSTTAKINGVSSRVEKPYMTGKTFMLPLEWFTTAIGAEVNKGKADDINIIFGEFISKITLGSTTYSSNGELSKLTAAPAVTNKVIMVPLDFITANFPVKVYSDLKKGSVKILLEDDGALTDLSFLTGGISHPKVGNSYYGWSFSVPSGSRVISNSFKSDKVGITNESRSLYFEVSVESKNGRSLSDLYNDTIYNNAVRSSKLDLKSTIPYFQYTRLTDYDESLRVKVFDKGNYFYYFTINCYDNSVSPEKLLTDKYFESIADSFSLSYKGAVKGVEDISKVKDGKAYYYNYLSISESTKYLPWSINIPAGWDRILPGDDPMTTCLGTDTGHYMKITMNALGDSETLAEHVERIKERYERYFNPKVYRFIAQSDTLTADTEAINLRLSIKQGGKDYIVDEFYILKGSFIYEISVKLPEKEYTKAIREYKDTIGAMVFYSMDEDKLLSDFEKYNDKNKEIRLSDSDDLFEYINKTFKWSLKLPGYWTKAGGGNDGLLNFSNPDSNTSVMVYSFENTALSRTQGDEEKFGVLRVLNKVYGANPVQTTVTEKGYMMRVYTSKVESPDKDFYATVVCYCFEAGNNSFCFTSIIPELTATEAAVKEVDEIWKSFKLTN